MVQRYSDVMKLLGTLEKAEIDEQWISTTERASKQKNDHLEQEMRNYRTNLLNNSIRVGSIE